MRAQAIANHETTTAGREDATAILVSAAINDPSDYVRWQAIQAIIKTAPEKLLEGPSIAMGLLQDEAIRSNRWSPYALEGSRSIEFATHFGDIQGSTKTVLAWLRDTTATEEAGSPNARELLIGLLSYCIHDTASVEALVRSKTLTNDEKAAVIGSIPLPQSEALTIAMQCVRAGRGPIVRAALEVIATESSSTPALERRIYTSLLSQSKSEPKKALQILQHISNNEEVLGVNPNSLFDQIRKIATSRASSKIVVEALTLLSERVSSLCRNSEQTNTAGTSDNKISKSVRLMLESQHNRGVREAAWIWDKFGDSKDPTLQKLAVRAAGDAVLGHPNPKLPRVKEASEKLNAGLARITSGEVVVADSVLIEAIRRCQSHSLHALRSFIVDEAFPAQVKEAALDAMVRLDRAGEGYDSDAYWIAIQHGVGEGHSRSCHLAPQVSDFCRGYSKLILDADAAPKVGGFLQAWLRSEKADSTSVRSLIETVIQQTPDLATRQRVLSELGRVAGKVAAMELHYAARLLDSEKQPSRSISAEVEALTDRLLRQAYPGVDRTLGAKLLSSSPEERAEALNEIAAKGRR